MKIGLVGCGRVGTTMFYLLRKRHRIIGVNDIVKSKEKRTMRFLGLTTNASLATLCAKSTAIFIATPDDVIARVYHSIKQHLTGRKYVFHFSGAICSTVFPKKKGIYRAAIHPFATFPVLKIPPTRKLFPLYIEGDKIAYNTAKRIFAGRMFRTRLIPRNDKTYYHLVGVFSSNLFIGFVGAVNALLKRAHLTQQDLQQSVLPIIKETLANIECKGIQDAISGPLERGDIATIKNHLKSLRRDPLLFESYRTLSLLLLDIMPGSKNKHLIMRLISNFK